MPKQPSMIERIGQGLVERWAIRLHQQRQRVERERQEKRLNRAQDD